MFSKNYQQQKVRLFIKKILSKKISLIDQNPSTPRYIIDFDPQLNEMVTEARYLEQFDYALPENIRHLALSVCRKYFIQIY